MPKRWTDAEIGRLLRYSRTMSQADAARKIGRSLPAVSQKAHRLGIIWRQGTVSPKKLAAELGCVAATIQRIIAALWPDSPPCYETHSARRYVLTHQQAQQVRIAMAQRPRAGRRLRRQMPLFS
ncbi:MAG: hypothetical protein KJN79_00095 [Gammaproteobacteria bacterium]|nr:hypothetical protein [Gammaproteobacteria bacterium]